MTERSDADPFSLSLDTVVASATLLGHPLEDRGPVSGAQDPALTAELTEASAVPLSNDAQRLLFTCAPLDILVGDNDGAPEFHLIELNGTGIGGVTNMPGAVVAPILASLREIARTVDDADGVALLGISGKESPDRPRLNKLMHEKMLFGEALAAGLRQRHGHVAVAAAPHALERPEVLAGDHPVVVLGYMKDLMAGLGVNRAGQVSFGHRPVRLILNDRFCLNVLDHFGKRADPRFLRPVNTCFLPGSDKAVAYALLNQFLEGSPQPCFPSQVRFQLTHHRRELVRTVIDFLSEGHHVVIKPHATGVGHGIEFFLDCDADHKRIIQTIDGSIRLTESYYDAAGGAFPYTVCQFVDTRLIDKAEHPLYRHKYELRVVVYRDGGVLRAFPSIVKVASRPYDAAAPDRLSLINNVTAATEQGDTRGVDFVLPLTNRATLELLGLSMDEMRSLCRTCTRYVRFVLDRLQDDPDRFGIDGGPEAVSVRADTA
jgi:hypothetical protein